MRRILLLLALFLTCACAAQQPRYAGGAVAADHVLASRAGAEILAAGGNAVDAAVATSFALSVVRPFSCGIGGGGFMVIVPPDGSPMALNYRETAPAAVGPTFFANPPVEGAGVASRDGGAAVGVPGTVAGLLAAHERYGQLPRAAVLAPAIALARGGYEADAAHRGAQESVEARLERFPLLGPVARETRDAFFGRRVRLPGQATVLQLIADHGAVGFYAGDVADAIVAAAAASGGVLTRDDLRAYEPRWVAPLSVDVGRGETLITMPPPSSGGVALGQIITVARTVLAREEINDRSDPRYHHVLVEAMQHAFADRAEHLADPEFAHVPVEKLLDRRNLEELAARIDLAMTAEAMTYGSMAPPPDDDGTSHFSVVDGDGWVVAATETINTSFGSLVTVPGYGFALNNELDDFTTPGRVNAYGLQQSAANLPGPGKRPLSSMSPTIVLRDGRPVLVLGASGGPRIISAVAQVLLNVAQFGDEPVVALARPRLHHQWMPKRVDLERDWDDQATVVFLEAMGHETRERGQIAVVQVIAIDADGTQLPACDPRKGGRPAGIAPK